MEAVHLVHGVSLLEWSELGKIKNGTHRDSVRVTIGLRRCPWDWFIDCFLRLINPV